MMNDDIQPGARIFKYVDNKYILLCHPKKVPPALQPILSMQEEWVQTNHIRLNAAKRSIMEFQFAKSPPAHYDLQITGHNLKIESCTRLLRLIVQNDPR